MSLLGDLLPYFVFVISFLAGALWLGYSVYDWQQRVKERRRQKAIPLEERVDKIVESLNRVVQELDQLKR